LEADILLVTHQHPDHNNIKAVSSSSSFLGYKRDTPFFVANQRFDISNNQFVIANPGEYEIKNIFIQGINSFHDNSQGKERGNNTIFTIESEGIRICHMGDFGQSELTESQLEKIGQIDILMIPVGGVYTISAKEAPKIMAEIEPKITIPMHYHLPKLKFKLDPVEKFLKTFGIKSLSPLKKLSIKKSDLKNEEAKIITLLP